MTQYLCWIVCLCSQINAQHIFYWNCMRFVRFYCSIIFHFVKNLSQFYCRHNDLSYTHTYLWLSFYVSSICLMWSCDELFSSMGWYTYLQYFCFSFRSVHLNLNTKITSLYCVQLLWFCWIESHAHRLVRAIDSTIVWNK